MMKSNMKPFFGPKFNMAANMATDNIFLFLDYCVQGNLLMSKVSYRYVLKHLSL